MGSGRVWSPSSIQPVDEVEPIRHSECSEKQEGARGEGDEASRSDFEATKGVFASRGAGSRPQASCESFGHVGRGRRDVPDHQGSSSEGRGPGPGTTNFRADQDHQDVHQPETKEGRADPVGDREGEGGFDQSSNRTGGARSFISRRRAEVRSTPREREGSAVAVHSSTACNHTERPGRVQQVARDYRQPAARTRTPSVWGALVSHIAGRRRRRHGGRSPSQENQGGITDPCSYQWLCAENTSQSLEVMVRSPDCGIHRPYNATPV